MFNIEKKVIMQSKETKLALSSEFIKENNITDQKKILFCKLYEALMFENMCQVVDFAIKKGSNKSRDELFKMLLKSKTTIEEIHRETLESVKIFNQEFNLGIEL